jgi:hypothetical protein
MPSRQPLATAKVPSLLDLIGRPKPTAHSSQTCEADLIIAIRYIDFLKEKGFYDKSNGERVGRLRSHVHGRGRAEDTIFYHPGQIVIFTRDEDSPYEDELVIETPLTRQALSRGVDNHTLAGVPEMFVEEIDVSRYVRPAEG